MISARDHVDHLAELDALAFIETCGRAFEGTDGDLAWLEDAWRNSAEDAGLDGEERRSLKRSYERALSRETRRLSTTKSE